VPASERAAGEILEGRYRLVERLGQGGFGDVFRAEELLPDGKRLREVALKLLVRGVATDWAEEARIIASLRHPALVTIYAAGLLAVDERPTPFVAMELLEGDNLAVFVERGRIVAWRRVLRWAREAAAALDEIHRAGVVHLDLKPANLFLTASGLKVLDFGIAQQGHEREAAIGVPEDDGMSTAAFMALDGPSARSSLASTGHGGTSRSVVGTPGFMAPEVVEGGEATFAADAYALAACIVQLVSGSLPQDVRPRPSRDQRADIESWIGEVRAATLHGKLRDLQPLALPSAFRELVARWLRLDPVARGITTGGLRAELDAIWLRPHGAHRIPFRGLAPFGSDDEGNLHGRDAETERLGRDLVREPCLVMHGPSGAGLTSLTLAGIVPALARLEAEDRHDWRAWHVVLGAKPDDSFALGLTALLGEIGTAASAASVDAPVERASPRGAPRLAIERLAARLECTEVGVVVVLEDLSALLEHPEGSHGVSEALAFAALTRPGLRIVALLEEDTLAAFLSTELGRSLQPYVRFVGMPSWAAADELVNDPARALGIRIDGAEAILDDVKAELARVGASLPVLGLAFAELWATTPSATRWREQGGVGGPLARHAEATLGAMPGDRRKMAEWLLLRMVRADGRMVEVEREALLETCEDVGLGRAVLGDLLSARIVVARSGKISLAHPALVGGWARLNDRRLHDLERRSFLEELHESALRWRQLGAPPHELWGAEKLALFEGRYRIAPDELRFEERTFIEASLRARRKARWLRSLVALGVLAVLVGAYLLDDLRSARARAQERAIAEASRMASIERLVTASRRTADPYRRVAMLGAAMEAGSRDRLLGLELFAATHSLPPARFLALEPPDSPRFPWDGRYLLGHTRAHVMLLDVLPDEGADWGSVETRFAAHDEGIFDVEPFAFGNGFVTRGLDGALKVWRLRESREIALAAESPMRCVRGLSRVLVADRAPVVACVTTEGLARWDLREASRVETVPFGGRLLAIAPDGEWIAAAKRGRVVLWRRSRKPIEVEVPADFATTLAAFSPAEEVLALVDAQHVIAFDLMKGTPRRLLEDRNLEHQLNEPAGVRFAANGVDLALCSSSGQGEWLYLRRGGRADEDGATPPADSACSAAAVPVNVGAAGESPRPRMLRSLRDYGERLLEAASVGPRRFEGGFGLPDGRLVTRDLVVFDPRDGGLTDIMRVGSPYVEAKGRSVGAVARAGDDVVWQYGASVMAESITGKARWSRDGSLGAVCRDGRVLIWRAAGDAWEVLDGARDVVVRRITRNPGFFLGIEPSCARFYVQWLDGRIATGSLTGSADVPVVPDEVDTGGGGYAVDGYVFDVRPSDGRGNTDAGLWLAFSSGALARADASGTLRSYGHASPRATAMGDGVTPDELLVADESGLVQRRRGMQDRRLIAALPDREWSDVHTLPDGAHAMASSVGGLALIDVERGEIVGTAVTEKIGRLAPWDDEGSLLSWSFAHIGPPSGDLVPIGLGLARAVVTRASNLVAEPVAAGAPRMRLR